MKRISDKRRAVIPKENRIKLFIYSMGNGLCELCKVKRIADKGHEIIFRSQGGSPVDSFNIIQLCNHCHDKQHNKIKDEPPDSKERLLGMVREIRLGQGFKGVNNG